MKTNLNKKTIVEFGTLTKATKTGLVSVSLVEDQFQVVVSFKNGDATNEFFTNKIGEITKLYDARNWNTTAPVEEVVEAIIESSVQPQKIVVPQIIIDRVDEIDQPIGHIVSDEEIQANWESVEEYADLRELESTMYINYICFNIDEMITLDGRVDGCITNHHNKSEMFRVLAEAGLPTSKIAKLFGAHYSYVHGVLKRAALPTTNTTKSAGPSKKQVVIDLYKNNKTTREIAEQVQTHISYVRTIIAAYKKEVK